MFAGVGWKSLNGSAICAQGYGYNPYGQRIRKETAEGITWYLYNEQGLAAEYDSTRQPAGGVPLHPAEPVDDQPDSAKKKRPDQLL
jgi:hypothetical protein